VIKVYCERHVFRKKLKSLEKDGLIQLLHFSYEGTNRKVAETDTPSMITADMTCWTADSTIRISDMRESDRYSEVLRCVGGNNWRDALHLDSAYKSKCRAFLTRDKGISKRKQQLESILGLRIFDPDKDWEHFFEYVKSVA
jgi:hypothetical protein